MRRQGGRPDAEKPWCGLPRTCCRRRSFGPAATKADDGATARGHGESDFVESGSRVHPMAKKRPRPIASVRSDFEKLLLDRALPRLGAGGRRPMAKTKGPHLAAPSGKR